MRTHLHDSVPQMIIGQRTLHAKSCAALLKQKKKTLGSVVHWFHVEISSLMLSTPYDFLNVWLLFQNPNHHKNHNLWNVGWPGCWDVLGGGLTQCSVMTKPGAGNQTLSETPNPLVDSLYGGREGDRQREQKQTCRNGGEGSNELAFKAEI